MFVHEECDLQFGADAVGTGTQDRLVDAVEVQFEQTAEPADAGQDAVRDRSGDVGLHEFDCFVAGRDVDTGSRVSFRLGIEHDMVSS